VLRSSVTPKAGLAIPSKFTTNEVTAFRRLKEATKRNLSNRLAATGKIVLDDKGRCIDVRLAVVPSISETCLQASLADVRRGDGGELRLPESGRPPSFHSAYSSCALAINTFGLWRLDPSGLTIDGRIGFSSLEFEAKFPINPTWRTAPNIDVVCHSSHDLVAIESKLTEHLDPRHTAEFRPGYDKAVESVAHSSWAGKYEQLRQDPDCYAFFNAAQIVKHYLGLKSNLDGQVTGREVTLLYLYWEPSDAKEHALFAYHRAAISAFSEGLRDEHIRFQAMSYPELWDLWLSEGQPIEHLNELHTRYLVDLRDNSTASKTKASL
jgi:hypothetical protein